MLGLHLVGALAVGVAHLAQLRRELVPQIGSAVADHLSGFLRALVALIRIAGVGSCVQVLQVVRGLSPSNVLGVDSLARREDDASAFIQNVGAGTAADERGLRGLWLRSRLRRIPGLLADLRGRALDAADLTLDRVRA